jgi:hypothetical protein
MAGRSRMNREVHVRICEGLGVRFPRATRLAILQFFRYNSYIKTEHILPECSYVKIPRFAANNSIRSS